MWLISMGGLPSLKSRGGVEEGVGGGGEMKEGLGREEENCGWDIKE